MNTFKIVGIVAIGLIALAILEVVSWAGHMSSDAATVVSNEIQPSAIQQKYVWFQDQKSAIDKADTDISNQIIAAKVKKTSDNRSNWTRTDKEQFSRSIDDIVGVIANRNNLIRDYNSAMSQWQMQYFNVGKWPAGSKYTQDDFRNFPEQIPEYSYGEEMLVLR